MNPWEVDYSASQQPKQVMPWEVDYGQNDAPAASPVMESPAPQEQTGFNATMRKRGADLANIVNATSQGQQTMPEGVAQGVMNEVGALGDAVGAGVGLAAKGIYAALPESGQKRIASDMERFSQVAAPVMQQYQQNQEAFDTANPRAGRNLQAVRELGNIVPLGFSPVRRVAGEGLDMAGSAVKNVARDTAMYPVEGAATVAKGIKTLGEDGIGSIKSDFTNQANRHYAAMREEGANINPKKVTDIFSKVDQSLSERGILNPALHGKTMAVIEDLKNAAKEGTLDLETLDQQRRVLSRIKPAIDSGEDAGMARAAVRAIDDGIDSITVDDLTKGSIDAVNNLYAGRKASQKAIKIEKISDILKQADGDPNRIKAGLTRFVNKKNNLNGFSKDEKDALMNASRSTAAEKILKMAGKFGVDLGTSLTPGNTVAPLVGGFVAGSPVAGGAVVGLGTIARQLQKYMARGKADEVIRAIQKGGTPKELMQLPASEARDIIKAIKSEQ